jgi:hypothetical protein
VWNLQARSLRIDHRILKAPNPTSAGPQGPSQKADMSRNKKILFIALGALLVVLHRRWHHRAESL